MRGACMTIKRNSRDASVEKSSLPGALRIGALSKLSGIPTPTLRAWERRYRAFHPTKTATGQRLYDRSDASRAVLIRGLADQGFSLSTLAQCELNELLHLKSTQTLKLGELAIAPGGATGDIQNKSLLRAVVVGESLALRVSQAKNLEAMRDCGLGFQVAKLVPKPNVLSSRRVDLVLMEVVSLLESHCEELLSIKASMQAKPLLVFYRFGAAHLVALLRHAGILVYREPIDDETLLNALKNISHELGRRHSKGSREQTQVAEPATLFSDQGVIAQKQAAPVTKPRRYSIAQIRMLAEQSPQLSCECPRHVSEILEQLLAFEDYTERCLSQSVQDIHIHAQLLQVAALARSQFEDALEAVASHEGIML